MINESNSLNGATLQMRAAYIVRTLVAGCRMPTINSKDDRIWMPDADTLNSKDDCVRMPDTETINSKDNGIWMPDSGCQTLISNAILVDAGYESGYFC